MNFILLAFCIQLFKYATSQIVQKGFYKKPIQDLHFTFAKQRKYFETFHLIFQICYITNHPQFLLKKCLCHLSNKSNILNICVQISKFVTS